MNIGWSFVCLLADLSVGYWGVTQYQHSHEVAIIMLLIVIAGMVYNNITLLIGNWVGQGTLLEKLNRLRYVFHNFCIPLLVVVGFDFLERTNTVWANQSVIIYGSWGLSLIIIAIGLVNCIGMELSLNNTTGILHYKAETSAAPLSTIITSLITAGVGLFLWIEMQWPWLFLGTIAMIFSNVIPANAIRTYASASTEIVFMLALFATASQIL